LTWNLKFTFFGNLSKQVLKRRRREGSKKWLIIKNKKSIKMKYIIIINVKYRFLHILFCYKNNDNNSINSSINNNNNIIIIHIMRLSHKSQASYKVDKVTWQFDVSWTVWKCCQKRNWLLKIKQIWWFEKKYHLFWV